MSAPAVLQGSVVEPSHVSQPHSYSARDFFNTVRTLISAHQYHNEQDRLTALGTVDAYEKHVTGADAPHVVSEGDRAPIEDVSLRTPPTQGLPPVAVAQQIDYARLAAAIVAAQNAAKADTHAVTPAGQVPDITSGMVQVPAA